MFKAIFWDNDGVLMETEHLYYRANAEALSSLGIELTPAVFQDISLGQGQSVLALAGAAEASLRPWRDQRYHELLGSEAAVIPGVNATLGRLHGRQPMAIVTSCRRVHFERMHRDSGLLDYFDFTLTREDYGNSKPDPEPYLTACRRVGQEPEACLAIEDSPRGVMAAARAGLAVAAIPGSMNRGGDFSAARWLLESVLQLPELLETGNP